MSAKDNLIARVTGQLADGEEILVTTVVQLKGGQKRELAKITVGGLAASLATIAASGGTVGLMVTAVPPAAWFVCTTARVLLIERKEYSPDSGATLFRAPRQALDARLQRRLLNEVTLHDRTDGLSLVRLNLGVRSGDARRIVHAVTEGTALVG